MRRGHADTALGFEGFLRVSDSEEVRGLVLSGVGGNSGWVRVGFYLGMSLGVARREIPRSPYMPVAYKFVYL